MQQFKNVDVVSFLEQVMKSNTKHHQEDFEVDKKALESAMISDSPDDKYLVWLSRENGTHCLKENDIFIINPNFSHSSYGEATGSTSILVVKNDFLFSNGFKEINGVFTDKINDDLLFEKYIKLLDVHFSHNSLREVEFRIALLDLLKYIFKVN